MNSGIKHGWMLFIVILVPVSLRAQRRIVSVPFRSVNTYMLVEASVDGRPVTLLVDTGANKTILNARSIGRVQLPVSQPVNQGAGIVGNAVRLRVDVEIAHLFLFSQAVSVMNPHAIHCCPGIYGMTEAEEGGNHWLSGCQVVSNEQKELSSSQPATRGIMGTLMGVPFDPHRPLQSS